MAARDDTTRAEMLPHPRPGFGLRVLSSILECGYWVNQSPWRKTGMWEIEPTGNISYPLLPQRALTAAYQMRSIDEG